MAAPSYLYHLEALLIPKYEIGPEKKCIQGCRGGRVTIFLPPPLFWQKLNKTEFLAWKQKIFSLPIGLRVRFKFLFTLIFLFACLRTITVFHT